MVLKVEIDISQCEKEPVRFIGAIQPFGAMLVLDKNFMVTHYSKNLKEISDLDGPKLLQKNFNPGLLDLNHFTQSILPTRSGCVVEIERTLFPTFLNLNPMLGTLQNATDVNGLLNEAACVMSQISQFDRVMVYKFHEDAHGEVVAESVRPGIDQFIGLHFPASDIPPQAREIFLENWVRSIGDVSYVPVPLLGSETETVDLGPSLFRAVSPIHIEYLKNMKVKASLTVSIIVEGKLWGLFACHHDKPKYLTKDIRDNCEVIARMTSALIRDSYLKEVSFHASKLSVINQKLLSKVSNTQDLSTELTESSPSLVDIIKSEGAAAALYVDGYWATIGQVPNEEQLNELVVWLGSQNTGDIFHTCELSKIFHPASAYASIASGLLAVPVSKHKRSYILWFRPEQIQDVKWAGNPAKVVNSEDGRLIPRDSFEVWKETVTGTSQPWEIWEINAAMELRNSVLALDLQKSSSRRL